MLLLASFSAVALVYSLQMGVFRVATRGILGHVDIGFYTNKDCTAPLEYIDWGILLPGSSKSHTIYLRNEGNVGLALTINMTNITPLDISKYISLTTDYDGHTLSPNQVVALPLTLNIASDAQAGDFSFDIEISYI